MLIDYIEILKLLLFKKSIGTITKRELKKLNVLCQWHSNNFK